MADVRMSLGWVIVYVEDPEAVARFYERAFGLTVAFVAPGGSYAEMATGETRLAFAAYELGEGNFPQGVQRATTEGRPANVELALVAEDVEAAHVQALDAGCQSLAPPQDKPQGQRVAFVRDPFGTLIELATPL